MASDPGKRLLTRSERFMRERRERWLAFAELTERAEKRVSSLREGELRDYPSLYRRACSDLAQARGLKLGQDVIDFLNESVARAHAVIYGRPPVDRSALKRFFARDLPRTVLDNWIAVAIAALLFFAPYYGVMAFVSADGDRASLFVPETALEQFSEAYETEIEGSSAGSSSLMTAFYIRNNVSIAFLSFASGILACLGSVYFIVSNAVYLGAVEGFLEHAGYAANLQAFTTAHSVFELTGLVLAGAAGLSLGYAVLRGGRYGRADALILLRKRIFPLIVAFSLCVAAAAFIEGFFSPHPFPFLVKAAVAIASGTVLVWYFVVVPLVSRFRGTDR